MWLTSGPTKIPQNGLPSNKGTIIRNLYYYYINDLNFCNSTAYNAWLGMAITLLLCYSMQCLVHNPKELILVRWLVTTHLSLDHISKVFFGALSGIGLIMRGSWHCGPTSWLTWLCGMEHCPAGKPSPQSYCRNHCQKRRKQAFFENKLVHGVTSCVLHKQKSALHQPCKYTPQTITDHQSDFTVGVRQCGF